MNYKDERETFTQLMQCTPGELLSRFTVSKNDGYFYFVEKQDHSHFIAISIDRKFDLAPVNSDFGFSRQAASNNYPELLALGKLFVKAFDLTVNW